MFSPCKEANGVRHKRLSDYDSPQLIQYASDFDKNGTVGKLRVPAFRRCLFYQNLMHNKKAVGCYSQRFASLL